MLKSSWRFTLGETVLLDYGDRMLRDPEFPLSARVQETGFVRSEWAKVFRRGNRVRSYSWSVIIESQSIAQCQTRMLQLPATYLAIPETTLKIEVEHGGAIEVENFALRSVRPFRRSNATPSELVLEFDGLGGEERVLSDFAPLFTSTEIFEDN